VTTVAPAATGSAKPRTAEMHPGPGMRIRPLPPPLPRRLVESLGAFETPAISDQMNRLYTMCSAIHPVTSTDRLVGTVCTVKVFPGDNLMVHKALDVAAPGDVIVVDASSSTVNAVLGDLVSTKARHRGIAGFVVDGLVRDLPGIEALGDFPVFARGITPIGPLHRGPGEIGGAVSVGGIVVHAGDVVVADVNGVVVVPRDDAELVLDRLTEREAQEAEYVAAVAAGQFSNAWVDRTLAEAGVPAEEARRIAAEAVVVAACESEWDPAAVVFDGRYLHAPHPNGNRYTAAGVFQLIRRVADRWVDGGYAAVLDPRRNVDAAARLFVHTRAAGFRGWEDWACAAASDGFRAASVLPGWPGGPAELPDWAWRY